MHTHFSNFLNLPISVVFGQGMKLTTHHHLGARLGMVLTILPHPCVSSWRAQGIFRLFFLAEINMIWIFLPHAVQKIRLINIILFYTRVTEDSTWTCFLSYFLFHSMQQSPSWEANRVSTSQETPHILWNPNVHYRVDKSPPPVSILIQINPGHAPSSHFLKIYLYVYIIISSTPGSPKWSPSFRFPHQYPVYISPLPHTCYMTCPSHSSRFDHSNNICCYEGWNFNSGNYLFTTYTK